MNKKIINQIKKYAVKNEVPIMMDDTIEYINNIINDNKITTILEIGTAIGYSTIIFSNNSSVKLMCSIERDKERYELAIENVNNSGLNNISLINEDALKVEMDVKFDLIIIDAAKAQNIKFFEKYKNNLNKNGIIIIDNMNFHGLVGNSDEIKSRNLRALVSKLEKFWEYIDTQKDYEVTHLDIGDGIVVCKKKNI